jgi:hypothetical protein
VVITPDVEPGASGSSVPVFDAGVTGVQVYGMNGIDEAVGGIVEEGMTVGGKIAVFTGCEYGMDGK